MRKDDEMPYMRISKRKGYRGKQKMGLGLHMGLFNVGVQVSNTISLDNHYNIVMSFGRLFEDEKLVNDIARWSALNKIIYMGGEPIDVMYRYLEIDTGLPLEFLKSSVVISDSGFFAPFMTALTGVKTLYANKTGDPHNDKLVMDFLTANASKLHQVDLDIIEGLKGVAAYHLVSCDQGLFAMSLEAK